MSMPVLVAKPPIWDRIVAAFPHVANRSGVIFAFGDRIYAPNGASMTPELRAHEAIHGKRQQAIGVEPWWDRYLAEPEFRLAEELPAHRAEYWAYCRRHSNRNQRGEFLRLVAERLAGPLYGGVIGVEKAKRAIISGAAA